MKFFSKHKTLSVISKVAKKRIALFENGEFETDYPELIEKLKPHFKFEAKVMSGLAGFLKLKKEAIDKGVYKKGMKKKNLIEVLNKKR